MTAPKRRAIKARTKIKIAIDRIDHFVLTVKDVAASCRFYERVLGLRRVDFDGRVALHFGSQKINLHRA
ncbi:MAG TPA: VOC family protein, partial [Stellaceae bacterium]|nr:VOC family protein [Stellaceae bacterium]